MEELKSAVKMIVIATIFLAAVLTIMDHRPEKQRPRLYWNPETQELQDTKP